MLLLQNIKSGYKTHTNFNEKAIKSIYLEDDVLSLSYITKLGNEAEFQFPLPDDADYFLYSTLEGYSEGQFSLELLKNFMDTVSVPILAHIPAADTGYGKLKNLNLGRFYIAQAIEVISSINNSSSKIRIFNRIFK